MLRFRHCPKKETVWYYDLGIVLKRKQFGVTLWALSLKGNSLVLRFRHCPKKEVVWCYALGIVLERK